MELPAKDRNLGPRLLPVIDLVAYSRGRPLAKKGNLNMIDMI